MVQDHPALIFKEPPEDASHGHNQTRGKLGETLSGAQGGLNSVNNLDRASQTNTVTAIGGPEGLS